MATAAQAEAVLTKAALAAATQQAEAAGPIESIEASSGNQEEVEAAFAPQERELAATGTIKRPPASLALVVVRGHFEDAMAKRPVGAPIPGGTVMSFVVNRGTGRVAAVSVRNVAPTPAPRAIIERPVVTPSSTARSASLRPSRGPRAHVATWGNNCKYATADHCYIVAAWNMKGGEEVYGVDTEQDTDYIDVPGWEKGYFVDNEAWQWAHSIGSSTWTEVGQQAGEFKGCCTTWWFYAYQNGTEGYNAFVDAPYVSEVPEAKGNTYLMTTSGGGTWCWYFSSSQELKACRSDFAWQATQLEAGGEIATEAKPTFDSSSNNAAEWTNYTWHTWNSGVPDVTTPGLCWSSLNGAPGNMYYDTCSGDEET
jgi:hypothetical protein